MAWFACRIIRDIIVSRTKGVTDWGDALTGKGVEVTLMIAGMLVACVQPWRKVCRNDY